MPSPRLALFGASLGSLALLGCATPKPPAAEAVADALTAPAFRQPGARGEETIFSPLNLPAPNGVRTADGRPGPDYWQQQVDYVIKAELNAEDRVIHGAAVVTYTNNSPNPLPFLWVHLEQNLFRADSTGTLTTAPETRFSNRRGFEGGVEIEYIRTVLSSDSDTAEDLPYHVYDTLARVDLPQPVPPRPKVIAALRLGDPPIKGNGLGNQFVFEIGWSFQIPKYGVDRMGIDEVSQGPIFEIAQWFPAVAVYDDVHGWNTLPYLGAGEFYTNFGSFDVELTVPHSHIVAATGVLVNREEVLTSTQIERLRQARESTETVMIRTPEEVTDPASRPPGDDPLTWHFQAERVRTFAWASSPAFIWDGAGIEGTLVQSVYPDEALPLWSQATDMLRFSIEHYSQKWFDYPYPAATNVNGSVGGMEYPMLIFCSDRDDEHGLYGVTTHEIGHNWFPMTVNTDERRHAWMDEGFNTFINIYSQQARYPGEPVGRGEPRSFAGFMSSRDQQPMDTPADQLRPGVLGSLEYAKTAVALYTLREQVLGPERFDAAFREYIRAWAFKSPRPWDFYRCMENSAGEDLAWFWREWMMETGTLDQAIDKVEPNKTGTQVRVTFSNRGQMVMPLDYRVTFEDGSTEDHRLPVEVWFSTNRWTSSLDTGGRRVAKVEIDPKELLPDTNPANNVWVAPPEAPAPKK